MKHIVHLLALSAFLAGPTSTANAQSINDSLIAYFPFDGSPNDVVGGLFPTVTSGTPSFCTDRFGNTNGAACFDGASFWSYGDVLDMDTSDFTMAVWLNIDSVRLPFEIQPNFLSEGSFIAGKGNTIFANPTRAGYSIIAFNNGAATALLHGTTGNDQDEVIHTPTNLGLDTWSHVVFSRCGVRQVIYVNGVLLADSIGEAIRDLNVNTVFSIGAMNRDPSTQPDSEWYIGALDDLRLYKGRCLSETEIDTLYYGLRVGLEEQGSAAPALQVFPNPVQDVLTIRTDPNWEGPIRTMILDAAGRVVRTPERSLLVGFGGLETFMIPLEGIAPGVYFVQVKGPDWETHGKFIKE